MATIALPSSPGFRNVEVERINRSAISISPWSLGQQAQRLPGSMWRLTLSLPQMSQSDAHTWIEFLDKLRGMSNTFNLDIDKYTTGTGGPGVLAFRLESESFSYSISTAMHFGLAFPVIQAFPSPSTS